MTFAGRADVRGAPARAGGHGQGARSTPSRTGPASRRRGRRASGSTRLRGRSVDVTPRGSDRVALFTAGESTYFLEPGRVTRVVALDVDDRVLVIVIEPGDGHDLDAILETADDVAASLRLR